MRYCVIQKIHYHYELLYSIGVQEVLQVLQANVPFFYINRVIFHEGKEGRGRRVMINLMILNLNKCLRVGEGPIIL